MYFNALGLVTDDQGDQTLFIRWRHINGLYKWMVEQEKPYQTYPGHPFTREQAGFVLAFYNGD